MVAPTQPCGFDHWPWQDCPKGVCVKKAPIKVPVKSAYDIDLPEPRKLVAPSLPTEVVGDGVAVPSVVSFVYEKRDAAKKRATMREVAKRYRARQKLKEAP